VAAVVVAVGGWTARRRARMHSRERARAQLAVCTLCVSDESNLRAFFFSHCPFSNLQDSRAVARASAPSRLQRPPNCTHNDAHTTCSCIAISCRRYERADALQKTKDTNNVMQIHISTYSAT
jgi:hypothetical protein